MGASAPTRPWRWVPTLYLAEGLPYATTVIVSVIVYKQLGLSNSAIAFYTSWLYLPWVLKPLWSPVVDILKTRRSWIWTMQIVIGAALAGIALTLPAPRFFQLSLAFFWLLAFSSATHDVAADGFYMLSLAPGEQSFFVGIRNSCYRIAMLCAQGALVILAGAVQKRTGTVAFSWQVAFAAIATLFVGLGVYHAWILPRPVADKNGTLDSVKSFRAEFAATFRAFFQKRDLGVLLLFLMFYRFGEAQLTKMIAPFLLEERAKGGLGLAVDDVGLVYGTLGVIALMLGGILGGVLVSRHGLRAWLWPMVFTMHLPNVAFVYLSWTQPDQLLIIGACVASEQFGYGFGFTAYMLYMIYAARGGHQTAHYAICTGFMALGMMLPGLWSGWLQEQIGYSNFFLWVLVATIPGFLVARLVRLEREFGRRTNR